MSHIDPWNNQFWEDLFMTYECPYCEEERNTVREEFLFIVSYDETRDKKERLYSLEVRGRSAEPIASIQTSKTTLPAGLAWVLLRAMEEKRLFK